MQAGGLALFVSVALLGSASPASAHGSGTTIGGESNITGQGTITTPLCLPAPRTTITLYNTGTFNDTSGIEHTARFVASEDYYFGPGGTYSDSACTMATAVDGTLTVSGEADCDPVSATYERRDSNYIIQTTTSTLCDLQGPGDDMHVSNLTYVGTQVACTQTATSPPVNTCDPVQPGGPEQEFLGTYTQT